MRASILISRDVFRRHPIAHSAELFLTVQASVLQSPSIQVSLSAPSVGIESIITYDPDASQNGDTMAQFGQQH